MLSVSSHRNRLAALTTILVFIAGTIPSGTPSSVAWSDIPRSLAPMNSGCLTAAIKDPNVEVLTGAAAEATLEALWQRAPRGNVSREARAKARAAMKAKGWNEVGPLTVIRTTPKGQLQRPAESLFSKIAQFFFPTVHAQEYPLSGQIGDSEGGYFWNSWDDGDPNTWEGEFGGWENQYYNSASGGAQHVLADPDAVVTWTDGSIALSEPAQAPGEYNTYKRDFLLCGLAGCTTGAFTCALLGPPGVGCYFTRCGLGVFSCGVYYLGRIGWDYYCRRHPGGFQC